MAARGFRRRASSCAGRLAAVLLAGAAASRLQSQDGAPRLPGPDAGALRARSATLAEDLHERILDHVSFRHQVATCADSMSVTVWERAGPHHDLTGRHTAPVAGLRAMPQGGQALTWSGDGSAIVWDVSSGAVLRELRHGGPVDCAAVLPGGARVATCGGGRCAIWDLATGRAEVTFAAPGTHVVEVFPRGDRLLLWGEAGAEIRDAATGALLCELRGRAGAVVDASIFPAGDRVVTAVAEWTLIWDVGKCQLLQEIRQAANITAVVAVDEGRAVATCTQTGHTRIWDALSGGRRQTLMQSGWWSIDFFDGLVAFPDGGRIATFHDMGVVIWDTLSETALHRLFTVPARTFGIVVSSSGDLVAACCSTGVRVWDARTGAPLEILPAPPAIALPDLCLVALVVGRVLDPLGVDRGISWRELP